MRWLVMVGERKMDGDGWNHQNQELKQQLATALL